MKIAWKNSISTRILIYFLVFGMLVVILFVSGFIHLETSQSEAIFSGILKAEYKRFLKDYNVNSSIPLPETDYMKFYIGLEGIPKDQQKIVEKLDFGYYETGIHGNIEGPNHVHFAVQPLPDRKERLYIILDTNVFGEGEDFLHLYMRVGLISVLAFSIFVAWFLSRWMSRPLRRLARLIEQSDPNSLPSGFSKSFPKDEVGLLAKALDKSMARIKAFLIREQQFTRDASHELRTPVTAMKGAVELLQQTPAHADKTVNRLAKRMDQSVSEMEAVIEALLWLSREKSSEDLNQVCEIVPIVEDITRQYQNQFKDKAINVDIETEEDLKIKASPAVVRITLSNLIRNAFQFTNEGDIYIRISDTQVEIKDTGQGISPDELDKVRQPYFRGKNSQGFGFGLDIVSRLCDRFGWQLEIESASGKGTTARLIFGKKMAVS